MTFPTPGSPTRRIQSVGVFFPSKQVSCKLVTSGTLFSLEVSINCYCVLHSHARAHRLTNPLWLFHMLINKKVHFVLQSLR